MVIAIIHWTIDYVFD